MPPLATTLSACVPLLPEEFRTRAARLWADEHLVKLAERLERFRDEGVPTEPPPPRFEAECTPSLEPAFAFFRNALQLGGRTEAALAPDLCQAFAEAMTAAGTANLLLLLGQRRTPASLTDEQGIPPMREELIASATRCHLDEPLTVAARALSKHAHRSREKFWGEVSGPVAVKNAAALGLLERILDGATWWNVFGHFQHETVFEARLPSGHGARWGHRADEFIGFLEPFDAEKCPSLTDPE